MNKALNLLLADKHLVSIRLILVITAIVLGAYLTTRGFAESYLQDPLGAWICILCFLVALIALILSMWKPRYLFADAERIANSIPRLGLWLIALMFWLRMLQLGTIMMPYFSLFALLPFYSWVVLAGLGLIWLAERGAAVPHQASPHSPKTKLVLLVAGLSAGLVFGRDIVLLRTFGVTIQPDSLGYIESGKHLLEATAGSGLVQRTLPYLLMNAITYSYANPLGLIWLQILISTLAVGYLTYTIGKKDLLLAGATGLFLVLDVDWGSWNRFVMTESPFMSFSVLSLAVLLNHFDRWKTLRTWELILAGVLYGWTLFIRPSNILLTLPILLVYLWLTRSWTKMTWVSAGMLLLFLANGALNLRQSGQYTPIEGSGVFVAWPLFSYHLFSPDNGPASQQLDEELRGCFGAPDYAAITVNTSNEHLHGQYLPCLTNRGWTADSISRHLNQAYVEAITQHPLVYLRVIAQEHASFLTFNVQYWLCNNYDWCMTVPDSTSGLSAKMLHRYAGVIAYTTQAYLLLIPHIDGVRAEANQIEAHQELTSDMGQSATGLSGAGAWFIMLGFLYLTTKGRIRFLAIACAVLVHYVAMSVIVGHVFIPRYALTLSPFYTMLSVITALVIIRAVWAAMQSPFRGGAADVQAIEETV